MSDEVISFNFKENWQESKKWFYFSLVLLIGIVILGAYIRSTNIPYLKDSTTGNYTLGPDLDPFLYLRIAHQIVDNGKQLNPDPFRYLGLGGAYYDFNQYGIVYIYKFLSIFSSNASLEYSAIIFPVIFFSLSTIFFFFMIKEVFYKKNNFQKNILAVLASLIYVVVPLMQHRTTAGIPELESSGLFFFWLSFFLFLRALRAEKKVFGIKGSYWLSLLAGISTVFMVFTWGGFRFILYCLALATLIYLLIGKIKTKETIIYSLWFIPSFIALGIKSGFVTSASDVTTGAIPLFVFLVLIVNLFLSQKIENKIRSMLKKEWVTKELISIGLTITLGLLVLLVFKPSLIINILGALKERLLYPFGRARISLTVAENQQLNVTELFSSFGKSFFWMFFFGLIFIFAETVKSFNKKDKMLSITSFILFLTGFIFSRYSPTSALNGDNLLSQTVFFGSLLILFASLFYIYIKDLKTENRLEKFKEIEFSHIFIMALSVMMVVASRGAIRLLVISSPVFVISMAFLPAALFSYRMKTKDDFLKFALVILLILSLVFFVMIFRGYESATANAARYTVPDPYTIQWQHAMAWVRDSTPIGSIFVHWWDYGYWVQTIGMRPTVTDGGHAIGYWDHLTGRYLLTTPKPETALSLMKTYNVSYLLIDSTDLGKYSAFSIIGSDANTADRFAQIPIMLNDPSTTQEKNGSEIRLYQGGAPVDEDIVYNSNGTDIFLPANSAGIGGMIVEVSKKSDGTFKFMQPYAVFIYNQKQVNIPVRYLKYNNQIFDFGGGLDAVIMVIPQITQTSQNVQIDRIGAAIYLSPRVSKGLFAQLYLLDDPNKEYPTVSLAHEEQDTIIGSLNSQGASLGDMVYFNGFRGPIKIWHVDYPSNILVRNEFLSTEGDYAQFDNLQFTA